MDVVLFDETDGRFNKQVEQDLAANGTVLDVRPALPADRDDAWLDWLSWKLAASKARTPDRRLEAGFEPMALEVEAERRALTGHGRPPGPLYDGVHAMAAWHGALPAALRGVDDPTIVLTDRLVGTFEGSRYHVRFLVAGHPSIVSVPGFVGGPARAREYYLAQQLGGGDAAEAVDDDHLTNSDARLATCVASAVLQAQQYASIGQAFCDDADCRLFNPHWQRELVASMATDRLCGRHAAP